MTADYASPEPTENRPAARPKSGGKKIIGLVAVVILVAVAAGVWLLLPAEQAPGPVKTTPDEASRKVKNQPVIEYSTTDKNALMEERKASLGIKDGLDMIVKEGEAIKVGDQTVSVKEIRDSIQAKEGGITEKDLTGAANGGAGAYGIHIVQPGDNIWNIHFKLLKAYMAGKNIALPEESDEPDRSGYSSGIGKLLKFSENMVWIYNIHDRQLAADIHVIRPLTKIVIYKMDRVFELLDEVDIENAARIRFDGENIWIPAD